MSDKLVERLRTTTQKTVDFNSFDRSGRVESILNNPDGPAAADEIERLRSALTEIQAHCDMAGDGGTLHVSFLQDITRNALKGVTP